MTRPFCRITATAVVALALSRGAATGQPQPAAVPDDLVITLERTQCLGECPVYKVSIDAMGNVTYEGKRFVHVTGRQTDRIPASHVAALLATAERIGFFELRDRYRTIRNPDGTLTIVTDLPTTFVTIRRAGRSKRVEDYIGAPDGLRELERQIDETVRTKRWIRLDEETLQQLVREGRPPSVEERAELLRKALQYDDVGVVRGLLELGADANAAYFGTNSPPLMMAHSAAAARALLEAGADPSMRNENGVTPLGWSVHVAPEVAEVLVKAGAPVNQPSGSDGRTPLWLAACNGNLGVVKILLGAGADPRPAFGGLSALQCAQQGRDDARSRKPVLHEGKPPFVKDFDGVISLLEQALAKWPVGH